MLNVSRYFHTLRYLRPVQICGRLWHQFYHPKPDLSPPPAIRPLAGVWRVPAGKIPSLTAPNRFRFLNEEHDVLSASDWNHSEWAKLWLYNLHYFDDLNAGNAAERLGWHHALISQWVAENPPAEGDGWDPYPISLRIVNWIKWVLAGNTPPPDALQSLAIQVRFLARRIEFHLLGNHLFANAKALVFAGCFFEGKEADSLLNKGINILSRELHEQVLADGGHFELSPMYHCIILEDLLDLINLIQSYAIAPVTQGSFADRLYNPSRKQKKSGFKLLPLAEEAKRMLVWLKGICHPDGQIALFNDAAFGMAAHPAELYEYAERLDIREHDATLPDRAAKTKTNIDTLSYGHIRLIHFKESGYIRVENGPLTAILDVAPIGSDYLPGHAHADTLTFEISLYGQRIIVDSGTSLYDAGPERQRQRGTAAHNTVLVDGMNSSEIWASFRVAQRARPFGVEIKETPEGAIIVRCAHDGYRRLSGKPIHWREWHFGNHSLTIHDVIEGNFTEAMGRFHFHPSVNLNGDSDLFSLFFPGGKMISCQIQKGCGQIVQTTYHPEFGLRVQNQCLEIQLNGNESQIVFNWE